MKLIEKFDSIRTLLTRRPFSFQAPYSLEECVARLEARSERLPHSFTPRNKPRVNISAMDNGDYWFIVERDAGQNLLVCVSGILSKQSGASTLVTGHGEIQRLTFWGLVVFAFVFLWIPIVDLLGELWLWWVALRARDKLIQLVYDALAQ